MGTITPTPGQLASAFAAARKADWPTELQAALEHPLYSRLVRMHALRLAQGHDDFAGQRVNHRPEVIRPEPPPIDAAQAAPPARRAPAARTQQAAAPQPALFDRKRAAAGDRD